MRLSHTRNAYMHSFYTYINDARIYDKLLLFHICKQPNIPVYGICKLCIYAFIVCIYKRCPHIWHLTFLPYMQATLHIQGGRKVLHQTETRALIQGFKWNHGSGWVGSKVKNVKLSYEAKAKCRERRRWGNKRRKKAAAPLALGFFCA